MSGTGLPGTWRGRPPQVWVLVVMLVLGSLLVLPAVIRPALADVPTGMMVAAAGLGPLLAAMLWVPGPRWLVPRLHVAAVAKLVLAYALVATAATGEGAMSSAIVIVWMGLYTAAFHPQRVARAYLVGSALGLGIALAANPVIVRWPSPWLVLVLSTVVASEVIGHVLHRTSQLATTDHLTDLPNRLGLYRRFEQESRDAARHQRSLALAVIDLDGFKLVNDRYGHIAGDRMLVALSRELSQQIRGRDGLFRIGGDEFLLLLPETTREGAERLLARLHDDSHGTWSYGISVVGAGEGLDAAMGRADRDMYDHKQARRQVPASQDDAADLAVDLST